MLQQARLRVQVTQMYVDTGHSKSPSHQQLHGCIIVLGHFIDGDDRRYSSGRIGIETRTRACACRTGY